jgi:hypothetical protein
VPKFSPPKLSLPKFTKRQKAGKAYLIPTAFAVFCSPFIHKTESEAQLFFRNI